MSATPSSPQAAKPEPSLAAIVRKLHAAELQHLRGLAAEQQAEIERLQAQVAELTREAQWADSRADMFQDLAHELQSLTPGARVGLTMDGHLGLLQ